jgi:hypothetical protein
MFSLSLALMNVSMHSEMVRCGPLTMMGFGVSPRSSCSWSSVALSSATVPEPIGKLSRKRAYGTCRTRFQSTDKSQPARSESPACDRLAFARCPPRNRTANVPSREKPGALPPSLLTSAFSPVRFVEQVSRKMGIFRVFRRNGRGNFSAVKTCWRREWDSKP